MLYENVICVKIEKNGQSRIPFFFITLLILVLELIFQRKKIPRYLIKKKKFVSGDLK